MCMLQRAADLPSFPHVGVRLGYPQAMELGLLARDQGQANRKSTGTPGVVGAAGVGASPDLL